MLTGRGVLEEKGCGMGWMRYPTSQEFHDLANVTQAMIWKGVAAVSRARIDIAQTRLLREETRELRLQAQEARTRSEAHDVRAAYSAERAHLAAEWVARVAARPRLPA